MNTTLYNELFNDARKESLIAFPIYGSYSDREVVDAEREAHLYQLLIEGVVRHCVNILIKDGEKQKSYWASEYARMILEEFDLDGPYKRGDRVQVIEGFNVGAHGVVEFVEPSGKVWVLRDHASKPVFYHPHELTLEDAK